MKLGLLNTADQRITSFNNIDNLRSFGLVLLKKTLHSEDYKFNQKGIIKYLQSCIDELEHQDFKTFYDVEDWLSDNIVYSMFNLMYNNSEQWVSTSNEMNITIKNHISDRILKAIKENESNESDSN